MDVALPMPRIQHDFYCAPWIWMDSSGSLRSFLVIGVEGAGNSFSSLVDYWQQEVNQAPDKIMLNQTFVCSSIMGSSSIYQGASRDAAPEDIPKEQIEKNDFKNATKFEPISYQ
uniref:Uncharacterized protein n=1 Tax=Micrurus surinamensis TaxID=129470 RepID=A0A2D4PH91_MICSU